MHGQQRPQFLVRCRFRHHSPAVAHQGRHNRGCRRHCRESAVSRSRTGGRGCDVGGLGYPQRSPALSPRLSRIGKRERRSSNFLRLRVSPLASGNHLESRFFARKRPSPLDDFSQAYVQQFRRVGCTVHPPHLSPETRGTAPLAPDSRLLFFASLRLCVSQLEISCLLRGLGLRLRWTGREACPT